MEDGIIGYTVRHSTFFLLALNCVKHFNLNNFRNDLSWFKRSFFQPRE